MKKVFPLTAAFFFLLLSQPAGAVEKNRLTRARARAAKGDILLRQSEFAGAEKLFRKAIAVEAALPTAYLGLGASLVAQRRFAEALDALEQAERRYVAWEQAIQAADLQVRQLAERQLLGVQDLADANSNRGPNAAIAGTTGMEQGNAGADRIATEQFITRDRFELEGFEAIPAQVFYLEGMAYLRTGRRNKGIEALQICLLINDKHHLAHYNLAVALFTQGDVEDAKSHLDVAVAAGVEPHAKFIADLEAAAGS